MLFQLLQEYLNQEMACQYQNLRHFQNHDDRALRIASHEPFLPMSQPTGGFGVSLGSYDTNLPYSGINYSLASSSGPSMLGSKNVYNSPNFQSMPFSYFLFLQTLSPFIHLNSLIFSHQVTKLDQLGNSWSL